MKFLNPRVHGYVDYVAVALLALAPTLFAFGGVAAAICYLAAIGMLGLQPLHRVSAGDGAPGAVHDSRRHRVLSLRLRSSLHPGCSGST